MILKKRKAIPDQEEESYFISMTDIMVGLLFIFVIIIMYFAFQLKEQVEERENYEKKASQHRSRILEEIRLILIEKGETEFTIDKEQGILRFPSKVFFASGQADIPPESRAAELSKKLAVAFSDVLRCSVFNENKRPFDTTYFCKAKNRDSIFIEALYIEGHTDNVPTGSRLREQYKIVNNLQLSARRATNTYQELINTQPVLTKFQSPQNEPVFAAAAFGDSRPLALNADEDGRASNRRIDIRLIMYVPATSGALEKYKTMLEGML